MTDIFISYKREEREQARQLAEALGAKGFSVWWDAEILPGEQYRAVTLEILENCSAALVIWSPRSTGSNWVLDEAQRALDRGVLVPVHLEPISAYPLGFGQVHAHNLVGWAGSADDAKFQPVLAAVQRLVGARPKPGPVAQTAQEAEAEIAFWRGVQDSRDPDDLQAYLDRYGEGLFAELARRKLAGLSESARAKPPRKRRRARTEAEAAPESELETEATHTAPTGIRSFADVEPVRDPPIGNNTYWPQPEPALRAGFSRWELAFIAVVVFVAGFALWPIGNVITSTQMFFAGDYTTMFSFAYAQNIYLMTPLLTGLAWGHDRVAAWCAAQPSAVVQRAPFIVLPALLVALAILAIVERNEWADRDAYILAAEKVHFYLWAATAWGAAAVARNWTPHFKRVLEQTPFIPKS
jgi:hypothetical protein